MYSFLVTFALASPSLSPANESSLVKRARNNQICKRATYERGIGTPLNSCPDGDKNGELCYTPCAQNYRGAGPVCWETCADGYHDDGAFCRRPWPLNIYPKKSYGRGAGNLPQCGEGKQVDAGLCYNSCKAGFSGVGPVCWQNCPASHPYACMRGCAISKDACLSLNNALGDPCA